MTHRKYISNDVIVGDICMITYKVHVLVKDERDHEADVYVEAENSIEASQKAVTQYAQKGIIAHTISVWRHKT